MATRFALASIFFILMASLIGLGVNQSGISNESLDSHQIKYSDNQSLILIWNASINDNESIGLAISPDGNYAVQYVKGFEDENDGSTVYGSVSLFQNVNKTPLWTFEIREDISGIAFSDSGEYIVVTTGQGNLYVWNKKSSIPLWNYSNNGARLQYPSISSDGGSIVVTDWITEEIIFFENFSSTPKWRISKGDAGGNVPQALISSNGDYIVVAEDFIQLYSNMSTIPIWEFPYSNSPGNQPARIEISKDQSTMVIGTYNGTSWTGQGDTTVYSGKTYLYDLTSQTLIWTYTDSSRNWGVKFALSDNGQFIARCDGDTGEIILFNNLTANPLWQYQIDNKCRGISISSDGTRILAGGGGLNYNGEVYLWNSNNNTPSWVYHYPEECAISSGFACLIGVELSDSGAGAYVYMQRRGLYYFAQDSDGDGIIDDLDGFPNDASETMDTDGDGIADHQDDDDDGDGVSDLQDSFPLDASAWNDSDGDGLPDELNQSITTELTLDLDIDNDGIINENDAFPFDASEWNDLDSDGYGDNSDDCIGNYGTSTIDRLGCIDQDGDGISDFNDDSPFDGNEGSQSVTDLLFNVILVLVSLGIALVTILKVVSKLRSDDEDWDDEDFDYYEAKSETRKKSPKREFIHPSIQSQQTFVNTWEELPEGEWLDNDEQGTHWYLDNDGNHWHSTDDGYAMYNKSD
ncbi:hypothetical protein N9L11_01480 [Euryarchaeota archaeon]|nr:hypothetical protein [Euryarchaeota archaeon]